ncbi:phage tail protein [Staphylococcus hominis]|uniref:phage tail protein n=1 Tax=Staphylococcus hominis TaxID=1290 RepID=UPI0028799FE0|nr:phage tail protein [Staphylococcus hominis]MDS3840644.1 phage tail protein [Staphylococcus hominis]
MAEANYSIKAQIEANTRKFKSAIQSAKKVAQNFKKTQESIKDTKLDGDSSGVMKAVKAAKESVESFDNVEGKAELDIDSSKLREQVNAAKGIVNSFDHLHADAELSADIKRARTNIEVLERYIDNVDNKDADIDVSADVSKAMKRLDILRTNLSSITNKNYDTEITADATRAREAIKRAKRELNDFARQRAKATLDVDIKSATSRIQMFKAMLRSIPNRVRTRLDVDGGNSLGFFRSLGAAIDESTKTWDKLATKIRTIGTVLGNMIKGALLSNISLLVPAIASLVPALMAVLNAIGVVSGGALGLAGAFGVAGAGAVAFGAMGISALTMLADGTLEATRETERYQASLDSLQDAWAGLIKQNQAQIFNTLANAIDTAKVALAGLTPFINGVSKGMEQASAKMLDWAKNSQVAQKFFEMMGTTGVRIFNNMLDAAGSFGSGLISVLTQIAPLAEWVSQGFKKMGQAFNEWAQSVEGQNAIKSFIEYTKQNLPLIGQIFGSTFRGIFNLMKAFAPNTHLVLQGLADMAKQFEQWSATIAESDGFKKFIEYVQENGPKLIQLLGNIINIIINVATAMAPFAAAVLDVAIAMTDFIEKLTEAHPAIGIMLGLIATLAGIFMTLGPPILGAIDFIGTFVSSIGGLSGVIGIATGAIDLLGGVLTALSGPVGVVIAIVGALIGVLVWLWNTNEGVREALTNAWDVISSTIGGAIQSVIDWFRQLYDNIMQTIQPLMPIFQQFGDMVNQILGVVVVQAINFLVEAFKGLWLAVSVIFTAIGAIVSSVIQLIVGLFTAFIQLITGDFSGALQTLQTTFTNVLDTIWTAVQSIFTQISEFIFASLNSILGTSISSWSQIWSSTTQFLSQIWSSVTQWFGQVASSVANWMRQAWSHITSIGSQWVSSIGSTVSNFFSQVANGFMRVVQSVWQHMQQAYSKVVSGGAQWVSGIVSAMSNFVSSVISGFVNAVSQVQSGMQRAYSTIVGFVGQFASAGMDLMRGLVRGIMNGMSWVVNAARNVAKSAVNAAKSALGIHSPSRVFKGIGQYVSQGLGIGIEKEGRHVVSGMGSMAQSITDAFNSNLAIPDITANMKKVSANMNAQVQHTHNIKTNPSQRVVRIEMDVDNEALAAIVNEQNANRDAIFTF